MRRLLLAAFLLAVGCSDPPTATLVFTPLGDPDNCAASEAEIVGGTVAVWVGLRQQGETIAQACVPADSAEGWEDLQDSLVGAGLLLEELPLDEPLDAFVMGLPGSCPPGDPSGGIRFCGRGEEPFTIDEEGGGTVEVRRICPAMSAAQDCFER